LKRKKKEKDGWKKHDLLFLLEMIRFFMNELISNSLLK